jgi:PIN domain nuclease of toxin-antitoxin system
MKLLLDTHVFLWFISGDPRLPAAMKDGICDPTNEVYVSVVSLWESLVKCQLGKLSIPEPPEMFLSTQRERHGFASLPLNEASVCRLVQLPPIHRDPFDRMLIAQALEHQLTFVTVDEALRRYPIAMFSY